MRTPIRAARRCILATIVCSLAIIGLTPGISQTGGEATVRSGKVTGERVNVRAQPAPGSEVITQVTAGDRLILREKVEPGLGAGSWYRVAVPNNTPLWVNTRHLNSGSKVLPERLHVRSGPGMNYSIMGTLTRGHSVSKLRRQGDWTAIVAPAEINAYVASQYVIPEQSGASILSLQPRGSGVSYVAPPAPLVSASELDSFNSLNATGLPELSDATMIAPEVPKYSPKPPQTSPQLPPVSPNVATRQERASAVPLSRPLKTYRAPPMKVARPAPKQVRPMVKREIIVRRIIEREGVVALALSPSSPTDYRLRNPESRRTMNYLSSKTREIKLKPWRGRKIRVRGEEFVDPRWPTRPIIEIESIRLSP